MEAVESLRGDPANLSVLGDTRKALTLTAEKDYRRLPTKIKTQAYYQFKRLYQRFPMAFTKEYFRSRYRDYDSFTDEQKKQVLEKEKQQDLVTLTRIGRDLH